MKHLLYTGLMCFIALSATGAFGDEPYQKVTQKTLFNGETLYEYRLKNGLQVLHVPRHQAKVLTFQIWFRVGSLNEKMDPRLRKTGLAHLFEHMMFRGSKKYPDGQFDQIIARIGGDRQNATTYFYRTNYYESIPSHQLHKLMEVESDRMANLNLTKEIFEKEKGAVVGELRRAMDSPTRKAWYELMELVYKTAPYRYTVLGTEKEIKGFSLKEAKYFYETFYAPNNATLIVIGDVKGEKLMELVTKYYGEMEAKTIPRPPIPDEPRQKKERRGVHTHPQATSQTLMMAWRIPSISSPDIVPLSMLSTHMAMGREATLRKLLVDTGIAVHASASTNSQPDLFQVFVQLADKHSAEEAIKIIDQEVASLQTKRISQQSFARARNQELLNLYGDISDNSSLGNWLGEFLMLSDNYMRGFEIIDAYKRIKPEDLKRVAKNYLKKSSRSIVIVRPRKGKG